MGSHSTPPGPLTLTVCMLSSATIPELFCCLLCLCFRRWPDALSGALGFSTLSLKLPPSLQAIQVTCLPSAACGCPGLTQKPRFSLLLSILLQAAAEVYSPLALCFVLFLLILILKSQAEDAKFKMKVISKHSTWTLYRRCKTSLKPGSLGESFFIKIHSSLV